MHCVSTVGGKIKKNRKMKKILSKLSILSVLLFFNACSEPHGTYLDLGGQDFWAFRTATNNVTANQTGRVEIPLFHISNTSTITPINVNVTFAEGEESLFTVTGTSFNSVDEFNRAIIVINYDIEKLDFNVPYTITLTLSEQPDYPFTGGASFVTTTRVNITRPLTFTNLGTGLYFSDWWEEEWPQPVQLGVEAVAWRLPNLHSNGRDIIIMYDGNGEVSVASQPAWSSVHGLVEVRGTGEKDGNVITMMIQHWIPGVGQFGTWEEILTLPD